MGGKEMVRLMGTEIFNFKNVGFGEVQYMNYHSLNRSASLKNVDVVGLYGQNGSGKTTLVEALDVLKNVLSGQEIPFKEFSGLIDESGNTKLASTFFIDAIEKKYKVYYEIVLKVDNNTEKINVVEEKIVYWIKGSSWKSQRDLFFKNPYYENDAILEQTSLSIQSEHMSQFKNIKFLGAMQTLAAVSAEGHISVFFNNRVRKNLSELKETAGIEAKNLFDVIENLIRFATADLHIIKVNQLSEINSNECIPLNMRYENEQSTMQACLPLFINGHGEIPRTFYSFCEKTINAINIALKSIIPNLQIEIEEKATLQKKDGQEYVQVEVYSNRKGKRFLTVYESEGIKRIISLLHFLISVYNNSSVCLVVDELDSGIFEYLLGELLGVLQMEMKGQLIFTSHNLRILEKLDTNNIICSTTNPDNRYIRLMGVNKNNNRRDFYIRSIAIGGQKEELYDGDELQSIGYSFRKAGKESRSNELKEFKELNELVKAAINSREKKPAIIEGDH